MKIVKCIFCSENIDIYKKHTLLVSSQDATIRACKDCDVECIVMDDRDKPKKLWK